MTANNEHIKLRRRMERLLGRTLSEAAWDLALKERYVEEALNPNYDTAQDSLFGFLTALLRVEDGRLRARAAKKPSVKSPGSPTQDLSARIEAVSRLAAEHAAGDEEILGFRRRVLGLDTPMNRDEAEAYLDLPEARGISPLEGGRTELLRYQNERVAHELHVWAGSPLDDLRRLAEGLATFYPWEPAQAAAFVLEGLIPLATPFMLHLPQTWHATRPTRATLVMEVDLWMPASAVMRAYRDAQRHVLPGHNRPIGSRSLDLVNFVMKNLPATWPKLREQWNTEHPSATYRDYRSFRWAFDQARRSLLFTTYRPYLGPIK
jgi:hypothetical protein